MRWEVKGVDAGTGKERMGNFEARNEEEAIAFANYNGLLVESVQKIEVGIPVLEYKKPKTPARPMVAPPPAPSDLPFPIVPRKRRRMFRRKMIAIQISGIVVGVALTVFIELDRHRAFSAQSSSGPTPLVAPHRPTLGISYDEVVGIDRDMALTVESEMDGTPRYVGTAPGGMRGMLVVGDRNDIEYVHYYVVLPTGWMEDGTDDDTPPAAAIEIIKLASFVTHDPHQAVKWVYQCVGDGEGTYETASGRRQATLEVKKNSLKIALGYKP